MSESSERALDTAFEAMANPHRRRLLVALLEHKLQAEDSTGSLDIESELGESEAVQLELHHNHLPKLEEFEYIEWNRDTREISTGAKWEEIAPLLEVIDKHSDRLSGG